VARNEEEEQEEDEERRRRRSERRRRSRNWLWQEGKGSQLVAVMLEGLGWGSVLGATAQLANGYP